MTVGEDAYMELSLSPQEQKTVEAFSEKIDLRDSAMILRYGAACQNRFAQFSDQVLKSVENDTLDEACGSISQLAEQLQSFSLEPEESGFWGLFSRKENRFDRWKERYDTALSQVEQLAGLLEGYENRLLRDSVLLERLYETNLSYYKELSMYIQAGQRKLDRERTVTLQPLLDASASGNVGDVQAAKDFSDLCDRLEKRLNDLALTRTISLQLAPQIRLLQNNHAVVMEKLHSTLKNTIPLWKEQMVLGLGLNRSQQALEAQKQAQALSGETLEKNAKALEAAAARLQRETDEESVDVQTLQTANQTLLQTLDEVLQAQQDVRQKRAAAENVLTQAECRVAQLSDKKE